MEADDFAPRFGRIEVIDGPVFDSPFSERLPAGIAIPAAFFKIIKRPDGQIIAFIVPQHPRSPRPENYLVSVEDIQRATGLILFPSSSNEEKARIRSNIW